jgi:RNA polymerase sigma factor (sigma-70 family)
MTTPPSPPPTAEQRRQAVARALGRAPTFLRYAARYAPSPEDAEDAYQQAMEIALQSAPSDEPRRFDAWFFAVVRNEALAAGRRRRREAPGTSADLAESDRAVAADARRPDVIAEWRERHADVKEALSGLSETQRSCLILRTAGLGHEQIAELTGRPLRQVERAISRGRARVIEWESAVASGAACERLRPAIDHVARGGGRPVDQRRVANHVRRCLPCRQVLAARRRLDPQLVALVPAALLPVGAPPSADVSIIAGYADRLAVAGGARLAQIGQLITELPAAGAGRLGAKGLALVAAAAAGLPILTTQIDDSATPPPIVSSAPGTGAAAPPSVTMTAPRRTPTPAPAPAPTTAPEPAESTPPRRAPSAAPGPAAELMPAPEVRTTRPVSRRVAAAQPAPPPRGTAAAEFGP